MTTYRVFRRMRFISHSIGFVILALWLSPFLASALAFDSGSTGAQGAFPPAVVPAGTAEITLDLRDGVVTFLPDGTATTLPNTPAGGFADGILHFTTVDIPAGVTVSTISNDAGTSVTFLAQGDVTVAGTLDVSGEDGGDSGNSRGGRGGAGGFKGGNGEIVKSSPGGGSGLGPGGGGGGGDIADGDGIGGGGGGGYGNPGANGENADPANGGSTYGTIGLLPLIAGSGGGGGSSGTDVGPAGGGGGGGGGGILIASSTTIDIAGTGAIVADGGAGGATGGGDSSGGGGGSGGAIRLMAETIAGSGALSAAGGVKGPSGAREGADGGVGRIRLEALFFTFTGTTTGVTNNGGLGVVFLPSVPTVRVVSVGGVVVPDAPIGNIGGTDVVLDTPGMFAVELAASEVPLGTTIEITAKPETDAAVVGPVTSLGLTGTLADSATTVDLTFPSGGLWFIEARATFTLP